MAQRVFSSPDHGSSLQNFVSISWRFMPYALQYLARLVCVGTASSLTKKVFRTQGTNLFCKRQIDELIEGYSLALGRFTSLLL